MKLSIANIFNVITTTSILLCTSFAFAANTTIDHNEKAFQAWASSVAVEAQQKGIRKTTTASFLNHLAFIPRTIELDRKQPHSTLTYEQYLDRVIPKDRLNRASDRFTTNKCIKSLPSTA